MCGRYYIDPDQEEIEGIARQLERENQKRPLPYPLKTRGEIFPSDVVPVQAGEDHYLPMQWGFRAFDKQLIINARSETALEKPLFKEAMRDRRCLIPASGYYEWAGSKGKKQRYAFFFPGQTLYLAACYRTEPGKDLPVFVILTREAEEAYRPIHTRMPVIIPKDRALAWLMEGPAPMYQPLLDLSFIESDGREGQASL